MPKKSKFLRSNVLKSRGMRQHYHGFSPFILLKIYLFKVLCSFETQIFRSRAITKIAQCWRITRFFYGSWAEKMVSKPILP